MVVIGTSISDHGDVTLRSGHESRSAQTERSERLVGRLCLVNHTGHMREMSSSDFKAKCLGIIDEVGDTGVRVVISKRGRRVAELIRYTGVDEGAPQATLRGTAHVVGDMTGPTVEPDTWRSV